MTDGTYRTGKGLHYDYDRQCWVQDGIIQRCGHTGACDCYGRTHEGLRCACAECLPLNEHKCPSPRDLTATEVYGLVSNIINSYSGDAGKEFVAAFRRDHRTLQQAFVRELVIPVLQGLAEDHQKGYFDPRNDAAGQFAVAALDATGDIYLPLI